MERLKHLTGRVTAAAASAVLLLTAAPMPAAAEAGTPTLLMNLVGGGSVIGIGYQLKVPDTLSDYTVTLDGEAVTPAEDGTFKSYEYAMNMTAPHKIVVTKGGEEVLTKETSVCSYLNTLLSDRSYSTYFGIAKSMLFYGGCAQAFFGVDPEHPANAGISESEVLKEEIPTDSFSKQNFNYLLDQSGAPVDYVGMNLALQSEIVFSLFFTATNSSQYAEDYLNLCTFGGKKAVFTKVSENYYKVSLTVNAKDLDTSVKFTGDDGMTEAFRPTQYLYAALQTEDTSLKKVCTALYNYGYAVKNASHGMGDALYKWETLEPVTNGRVTCYSYRTGNAHLDDYLTEHDLYAVALTDEYYAKYAGAMIEITYKDAGGAKKTVKALAADKMPIAEQTNNRHEGDIDLDEPGFYALTGKTLAQGGDFPVEWRIVELTPALESNIYYHLVQGSSQWYLKIQPRSSLYPLSRFEYMDDNDNYHEVQRTDDNCYEIQYDETTPFNVHHMTFRMTDIFGETITEENVDLGITERLTADADVPEGANAVQFSRDIA